MFFDADIPCLSIAWYDDLGFVPGQFSLTGRKRENMILSLQKDVQRLIDERVKSGQYTSAEDVIAAAILTLDQQERLGKFGPGELDDLLAEGEKSIEEHGTLDSDDAFARRKEARQRSRNKLR